MNILQNIPTITLDSECLKLIEGYMRQRKIAECPNAFSALVQFGATREEYERMREERIREETTLAEIRRENDSARYQQQYYNEHYYRDYNPPPLSTMFKIKELK